MKTKLLRKLRRLAKKAVVMRATVNSYSEISYKIYRTTAESEFVSYKYPTFRNEEKSKAIDCLKNARRRYILEKLSKIREDVLNKELRKI